MMKKTPKTIIRLRASESLRKPLKSLLHWRRTCILHGGQPSLLRITSFQSDHTSSTAHT
jgi:hypothetical protein